LDILQCHISVLRREKKGILSGDKGRRQRQKGINLA
jgi:hypothetical protein